MEELESIRERGTGLTPPVFVHPVSGLRASPFRGSTNKNQATADSILVEYLQLFKRRRSMILLFALAGAFAGWLSTVGVEPVYRARTSLDIQSVNSDFLNMKAVSQTGSESPSTEAYVQTQIKLLQSETLRERTVDAVKHAGSVPGLEHEDLLSNVKQRLHLMEDKPGAKQAMLAYTAKKVAVKPIGITRLVEVTCDSWSASFAAEFCNSLTREFANQDREVRLNQAKTTSAWLSRQLSDVRESVDQAQKKLEARIGNDALTLKEGGASVAEEKLRELQSELMKAQAVRVEKQAQYLISVSAAPSSLPVVLDSSQLREDQIKLDDLRRQVAALVPPLTEANSKVRHLRSQIREVEDSLSKETSNVLQRIQNEYKESSNREALLNTEYRAQEVRVSQEQGREAQVSMLRKEVDSGEQLYQTLLQRVKEAGIASAMQAPTIRVVDAAEPPLMPIAPRSATSSSIGLLLGLLLGVAAAFSRERTQTVLRAPGEVSRYLNLRELGVIPSTRRGLGLPSAMGLPRPKPVRMLRSSTKSVRPVPKHASLVAEAYRNTTYSVLLAGSEIDRAQTFVITSPGVGDGKTTVTCNLGLALAQANRRILLIDGDLRKPRLHKAMDVRNKIGLRNLLRGDIEIESAATESFCQKTWVPGLSVLTSGTGSEEPSGLLHSLRFRSLLDRVTSEFDFVLIDSPPMLHMADARILAGISNGVILVFRARVTNIETATASRDLFLDDRVRVIGTILNDFDPNKEGRARYYKSYYQYTDLSQTVLTEESKSA